MNSFKILYRNIVYYRKSNIYIALATSLCIAVILGSLAVGDSVKHSLLTISEQHIGKTTQVLFSSERNISTNIARSISNLPNYKASTVLHTTAILTNRKTGEQLNKVNVYGIDSSFFGFSSFKQYQIENEETIFINTAIQNRLSLKQGSSIMLSIPKASDISINTPFVSSNTSFVSIRDTVSDILDDLHFGNFTLLSTQTEPYNVFIPIKKLKETLDISTDGNIVLFEDLKRTNALRAQIISLWNLDDAGYQLETTFKTDVYQLKAKNIFIKEDFITKLNERFDSIVPITTYFVNEFSTSDLTTPYSFISTSNTLSVPLLNSEIIITDWLAEDLKLNVNDSIEINYFKTGALRSLEEKTIKLKVKAIIDIKKTIHLSETVPGFSGMTDVDNCTDWDTDLPIDLKKIRAKDEAFWDNYKGLPKAYISIQLARSLFSNTYGTYTSCFIKSKLPVKTIENEILKNTDLSEVGFSLRNIKDETNTAAKNGVDFGSLFFSLNFFIVIAVIFLLYSIVQLNISNRKNDLLLYSNLGYTTKKITQLIMSEILIISILSILFGLMGGMAFLRATIYAINLLWIDIVRTTSLLPVILGSTYIISILMALIITLLTSYFAIRKSISNPKGILKKIKLLKPERKKIRLSILIVFLMSIGISPFFFLNNSPSLLYLSGLPLTAALIIWFHLYIYSQNSGKLLFRKMHIRNLYYNNNRSITIVSLVAVGLFISISTGVNKIPPTLSNSSKSSGTGGYQFWCELTSPINFDIGNTKGLKDANLATLTEWNLLPMSKLNGNDASCLNLNKIEKPALTGVPTEIIHERSSFSISTILNGIAKKDVWKRMQYRLKDGSIPAIADQTVIQWGMMSKVGNKLWYKTEIGDSILVTLIAGLKNSIFQGTILIDQKWMHNFYPTNDRINGLLAEAPSHVDDLKSSEKTLQNSLRLYGAEIEQTADRMNRFSSVNNTYLLIFMQSGILGMLLGLFGLSFLMLRDLNNRSDEIRTLSYLGIGNKILITQIHKEYLTLLYTGIVIGILPVSIALYFIPSIDFSLKQLLVILILFMSIGTAIIFANSYRYFKKYVYVNTSFQCEI